LQQIRVTQLETRELTIQQLTLFDDLLENGAQADPLATLSAKLQPRLGQVFFHGSVAETHHPLPKRRITFERIRA